MRISLIFRVIPLLTLTLLAAGGCKSAYVEADIVNATPAAVTLVELDYPSASFGTQAVGAGTTYHYRFKILGDGATKILWTDAEHHDHSVTGPVLKEGQQGSITVTITGASAQWNTRLQP
jgi:hypothetical protein